MYADLFRDFLSSSDTLRIYEFEENALVFSSEKGRLLPLLEYLDGPGAHYEQVIVFDKVIGNAAALLLIIAGCRIVYSPLGSDIAIETLNEYGIPYFFTATVPHIKHANGIDMCPMEKLSLGKTPEEFHETMKELVRQSQESGGGNG